MIPIHNHQGLVANIRVSNSFPFWVEHPITRHDDIFAASPSYLPGIIIFFESTIVKVAVIPVIILIVISIIGIFMMAFFLVLPFIPIAFSLRNGYYQNQ